MKRYLSLILVVAIALLMLTACQQDGNENNQDQPDEIERTQDSSVEILQADKILIERAVDLLVDQWKAIAGEDDCNNGHLEIKNTRILHINSDEIVEALGVEGVESIVEFVIFTDYFGAAPYYYETQHMNNVVFFSDGTSAVITNAVQMYSGKTYDASLKNVPSLFLIAKQHSIKFLT